MTTEIFMGVPVQVKSIYRVDSVIIGDAEEALPIIEHGEAKKRWEKIDELVFFIPDYDFNRAKSYTTLSASSFGINDLPVAVPLFLAKGDNFESQELEVTARSREGLDVSVSIGYGNRRAKFRINQDTMEPELVLEERERQDWRKSPVVEKISWEQIDSLLETIARSQK